MPNWFYFDKNEKKGPFTSEELFHLATSGVVRLGTIVETDDGRQTLAKNVTGLFPSQEPATKPFVMAPPIAAPPPASSENQGTPPVAKPTPPETPLPPPEKEVLSTQESAVLSEKTSEWEQKRSSRIPFILLIACGFLSLTFCCLGGYFAGEAIQERKNTAKIIAQYLESPRTDTDMFVCHYFIISYNTLSLQHSIHLSASFLLAGMFGVLTIFFLWFLHR